MTIDEHRKQSCILFNDFNECLGAYINCVNDWQADHDALVQERDALKAEVARLNELVVTERNSGYAKGYLERSAVVDTLTARVQELEAQVDVLGSKAESYKSYLDKTNIELPGSTQW